MWHQTNRQGISTELVEVAWLIGPLERLAEIQRCNNSRAILCFSIIKVPATHAGLIEKEYRYA